MRFGHSKVELVDKWYWTDGEIVDFMGGWVRLINSASGHALETPGVWTHSFDNSEVAWFPPKMTCGCGGTSNPVAPCYTGGDALLFSIYTVHKWNGAWCDEFKTHSYNFICEGVI